MSGGFCQRSMAVVAMWAMAQVAAAQTVASSAATAGAEHPVATGVAEIVMIAVTIGIGASIIAAVFKPPFKQ